MPPRTKARLTAKAKREIAAEARLAGHPLWKCAQLAGYSNEASAATAIREYLKSNPPENIEELRELEYQRLEAMRLGLMELRDRLFEILGKAHVVVQHGKVVGRFSGWATDNDGRPITDGAGKLVATYDEIEDDDPSIRVIAELRQNTMALAKISESMRRLMGLDKPVKIQVVDEDELDQEIEDLVAELNGRPAALPPGHPG